MTTGAWSRSALTGPKLLQQSQATGVWALFVPQGDDGVETRRTPRRQPASQRTHDNEHDDGADKRQSVARLEVEKERLHELRRPQACSGADELRVPEILIILFPEILITSPPEILAVWS